MGMAIARLVTSLWPRTRNTKALCHRFVVVGVMGRNIPERNSPINFGLRGFC